ncbi:PAS domain S-box protein [Kaarinaea lacus]
MLLNKRSIPKPIISDEVVARWQRRVDLLANIIGVPAGLIRELGPKHLQVRITSAGGNNPYQSGDQQDNDLPSYCGSVLAQRVPLLICNALEESAWKHSPEVQRGLISYFGCCLQWPDGEAYGTLCVLDSRENAFSAEHQALLLEFKTMIESDLEKLAYQLASTSDEYKLWHAIQSASLESILVMDTQGTFLSANEIGASRFRMTPSELVGKNLYNIVPAEVAETRKKNINKVIKHKRSMRFEDSRDGRYFDFTVYPVLNKRSEVEKLVIFAADISERIYTRSALEKSERKYRELVDEAATVILRWDIRGNVTFFNEYAQTFFGFTEAEILGRNVVGTIVPETEFTGRDLSNLMEEICRDPAKFEDNENENIKRNGERVWIAWKNRPIYNEQGELFEIHSVGIDITARKRAEDALRQSEATWRTLTECSPEHIMMIDRECNIVFINYTVPDLSPEKVLGKSIVSFLPAEYAESTKAILDKVWRTGESDQYTVEYHAKDHHIRYFECNVVPLKNDGDITALVVSARDITERKRIENELAQHQNHLESLVAIRTAELEASNKELESYSYSIAHDLRAPLRAITGFSQILKEDAKDKLCADDMEIVERIVIAGKNMSLLIDDILELSRITRSKLNHEVVDLTKLGYEIFNRLQQSQPTRDVQWHIQDNLIASGDPRLLEVALQNLVENAWKYTCSRSTAQIQLGAVDHNGEKAYFIKDNGVGFEMQYAGQLFKPFHRLHSPAEFEGTGVGLATVQRIVQRHGGQIWVNAKVNSGATFYFTLSQSKL